MNAPRSGLCLPFFLSGEHVGERRPAIPTTIKALQVTVTPPPPAAVARPPSPRRCGPSDRPHHAYGDCVIPDALDYLLPPPGWLLAELAKAAAASSESPADKYFTPYHRDYVAALVSALSRWEETGEIRPPPRPPRPEKKAK